MKGITENQKKKVFSKERSKKLHNFRKSISKVHGIEKMIIVRWKEIFLKNHIYEIIKHRMCFCSLNFSGT